MLFDALVVRTTLVPALGFLFGRWIWWPADLSRHPVERPVKLVAVPPGQLPEPDYTPVDDPVLPDWERLGGGSSRYR